MSQEIGSASVLGQSVLNNDSLTLTRLDVGYWEINPGGPFGIGEFQVLVVPNAGEDPPGDPVSAGYRVVGHNGDPDDARIRVCTWKNGALADVGFSVRILRQVDV